MWEGAEKVRGQAQRPRVAMWGDSGWFGMATEENERGSCEGRMG